MGSWLLDRINARETNTRSVSEVQACRRAFPTSKHFQLIVADPPWSYRKYVQETPYASMSLADLKQLPVSQIADPAGAVLLLWTSGPKLDDALAVIEAWGFEYKTVLFTWNKVDRAGVPVLGLGRYTRPSLEFVLLATRGRVRPSRWIAGHSVRQLFSAARLGHSEKPDLTPWLAQLFDPTKVRRRIELFARSVRPGWSAWGLSLGQAGYTVLQ